MVRAKENPEFDQEFFEDQEQDWLTLSYSHNKVSVLDLVESDKKYHPKLKKNYLVNTIFFIQILKDYLLEF